MMSIDSFQMHIIKMSAIVLSSINTIAEYCELSNTPFDNFFNKNMMRSLKLIMLFFIATIGIVDKAYCQAVIKGFVTGDVSEVQYFKPLKKYGNYEIISSLKLDKQGRFSVNFDIDQPVTTQFMVGGKVIWLLIEPTDTIDLHINTFVSIHKDKWLNINGRNAIGNEFYNTIYNVKPMEKFLNFFSLFEKEHKNTVDFLISQVEKELSNQVRWIDSLYNIKCVSRNYADFMKTEVKSVLAWEVGHLCDKYYNSNFSVDKNNKSHLFKKKLFDIVDPLDPKLKTCVLGHAYYETYFQDLQDYGHHTIDTSKVIIGENAFIELAPADLQEFLWGRSVMIYINNAPDLYDPCVLYKKYKNMYKSNEYIKHLDTINVCRSVSKTDDYKFVKSNHVSFFGLLLSNFSGKRLFIDLWATWCLPCKAEFKYYNSSFYDMMKTYGVEMLFISIDKKERTLMWERTVKNANLKGYHLLANEQLVSSIKEIIYGRKNISIPRYIFVNEQGQILTEDAKRPSDPMLKNQLETFYKK